MSFDYNHSLWGAGTANLSWSSPTSFRLSQALHAIAPLQAGDTVLEIGSGLGQFIRAIKLARPELTCHGCDISEPAITAARGFGDGVIYTLNNEQSLPYPTASYNAVLIFDVLEHVPDPALLLNEVCRVLKPGGRLYAFVPCEGDSLSLWHWLEKLHLKKDLTKKYAGHIQYFSRVSLRKEIEQVGLKIRQIHYGEHLLGQLLGVLSFNLMHRAAKRQGVTQLNNEAYFAKLEEKNSGGFLRLIKNIVNSLVNVESRIFYKVPSPNVHIIAEK